jgi:hypothetical protein
LVQRLQTGAVMHCLFSPRAVIFLLFGASLAVPACSSRITKSSGPVGSGGDGGTGGRPVACTWSHLAPTATCLTGTCPVTLDEVLTCDDTNVGTPGVRVAPAADATWLVTASDNDRLVYRISAAGEERQEAIPKDFARTTMSLAVAPDGTAYIGANATTIVPNTSPAQFTGGATLGTYANGAWTTSLIDHDPTRNSPVTGVDIGANGQPLLWFKGTGPTGYFVASPSGASWSIADAAVPVSEGDGSEQQFARASDGSIVGLAYAVTTTSSQLRALVGGTVVALGSPIDSIALPTFAYASGPSPSGAGPLFAVAVPHMDRIEVVAEFSNDVETSVAIPGAARPILTCLFPAADHCSGSCHETASGVEGGMFGLGWTDDGVAWLAYVVTHFDENIAWSA